MTLLAAATLLVFPSLAAAQPDLQISRVTPQSYPAGQDGHNINTQVSIRVSMRNAGTTAVSGRVCLRLLVMIQPYGSDRCYYGLAPGAEVSATYWWTPTVAGQYSLIGVADARDDVRESSESNNTLNAFVNVLSPDTTPPPAPPLQSPPDGETLSPGSVRLAWQPVADPGSNGVRYDVQVSRLSGFGLLADSASNLDGQWFNTRELSAGTYYWRVRSKDYRNNTSAWSPAWSFRIAASSLSGWITAAGGGGGIMNATVTVTSY
ncbi:MAG: hypothetical protein IT305_12370, partial [Chloroflexi bacterium]|nr:hypothetical protein [Chloroflexota bacterium]